VDYQAVVDWMWAIGKPITVVIDLDGELTVEGAVPTRESSLRVAV